MHIVSGLDNSNQVQNLPILNILYIEKNFKDSISISKSNFKNMNVISCASLVDSSKLIESNSFDIILCDLGFDIESLSTFFDRHGSKIPIIAFSSTTDPALAYNAAKLGACDFFYKSESSLKNLSQMIIQTYNIWLKKKNRDRIADLVQDPDNLLVIKNLVHTDLPITQKIASYYNHEFHINNIVKQNYNINTNDIISKRPDILESFVNMDILKKEPLEQTLVCPNCDSVNITPHYCCNKCNNSLFNKKQLLHHTLCKELVEIQSNNESIISCPKCLTAFENNALEWEKVSGFSCRKCNGLFTEPLVYYSCNNCNFEPFNSNEGNWGTLFEYHLNNENINKLKNDLFMLDDLETYLKKIGYSVDYYKKYIYEGKNYGPFDLAASNDRKSILFVILGHDIEKNLEKIFEIESLERNLKKNALFFAISFFKPSRALLYLLKKFNIIPLFLERNMDVSNYVKSYF